MYHCVREVLLQIMIRTRDISWDCSRPIILIFHQEFMNLTDDKMVDDSTKKLCGRYCSDDDLYDVPSDCRVVARLAQTRGNGPLKSTGHQNINTGRISVKLYLIPLLAIKITK
jgi:hypothetical protein